MKQERLNLYFLDMKYVRYLHNADDRVQSVSPQIHKNNRPFVGIMQTPYAQLGNHRLPNSEKSR